MTTLGESDAAADPPVGSPRPKFVEHASVLIGSAALLTPVYGAIASVVALSTSGGVQVSMLEAVSQPIPALALNGAIPASYAVASVAFGALSVLPELCVGGPSPILTDRLPATVQHPQFLGGVVMATVGIFALFFSVSVAMLLFLMAVTNFVWAFTPRLAPRSRFLVVLLVAAVGVPLIVNSVAPSVQTRDFVFEDAVDLEPGVYAVLPQTGDQILLFSCDSSERPVPGVAVSLGRVVRSEPAQFEQSRPVPSGFGFELHCPEA